jgi:hypothetical protein
MMADERIDHRNLPVRLDPLSFFVSVAEASTPSFAPFIRNVQQ